jgi:hypothetical protein
MSEFPVMVFQQESKNVPIFKTTEHANTSKCEMFYNFCSFV